MKSNILIVVLGVLMVLTGFAQVCEASQIPKLDKPAAIEVKAGGAVRTMIKPRPAFQGQTLQAEIQAGKLSEGILALDLEKLTFIRQQFLANNPNDYDGDGIPNNIDVVCQNSPKQLVMLTKAQQAPGSNDYIFTVDQDQNLSSDVTINNFLLRYVDFIGTQATLMSPQNPSQIGTTTSGYNCHWPIVGSAQSVTVYKDEWNRISDLCGNTLVRWIYHDEVTDNVIFQFINLTQVPEACIHPDPGPYEGDVAAYQAIMQPIKNSPECQDLMYDWSRFSQIAHREALPHNHPVGCTIDFPIVPYTGSTQGPCHPGKSCIEVSGDCASAGLEGDCSNMTNCCTQPIVQ